MNLKEQRAAALKAAQTIIETAAASDRDLTDAEVAQVEGKFGEIESLDKLIAKAEKSATLINGLNSLGTAMPDDSWEAGSPKAGGIFTEGQARDLATAWSSKGRFRTHVELPRTKAATLRGDLIPPAGQDVIQAPSPATATALRDLFDAHQAAPGPVIRYYTIGNGSAAVVAEGDLKPDAGVTTGHVDAPLVKLAATFRYSDELSTDAAFLVREIGNNVVRAVLAQENAQIVAAWTNSDHMLFNGTPDAAIDAVAGAIGQSESFNGVSPTTLVAHPVDVAAMRTAKAATSGVYHVDPLTAGPSSLFGLQVTPTPAVAQGTLWLTTPQFGTFYSDTNGGQGGVRVEAGFSGDDFERNMTTVRVEERILPAITQPSFITQITLAAA